MTSRLSELASIPLWASITALLVVLMPGTVFATHFELSRLATEIELISDRLADDLRYTRHYGSVRQRAVTLRRESSQLADSLQRNRSNSRIRSQFKDVRRGYERLEQAFFTADRRDHVPSLYREINLLSNVFASLTDEIYYAGLGGQSYGPIYNAPYSGVVIGSGYSGSRHTVARQPRASRWSSRQSGSRHVSPRQYKNRDIDLRSSGRIEPARERAIPQAFRGNNFRANSNRQSGRGGISQSSRNVQRTQSADHSSPVLERQARQSRDRRELESQSRHNRSSVTPRQQSRGANVQRDRSSRGRVPDSRRRNHYD